MKKYFLLTAVLVGTLFGAYSLYKKIKGEESDTTYREVVVERGDLSVHILSTGTVSPENRLDIKPPIAGRVERILVKEGEKVRKGQVLAWMSSTERAALLDAAMSQGAAEVKIWEEMYKPTPILAPINGTIILRNVKEGQTFSNADAIFTMSDRLTVKAQVDETDISKVKVRQKATIVLDAYSREDIPGVVDQIAFDARVVNNVTTYLVDVLPLETPEFMRSGMTANVTFDIETKENILLIPAEALRVSGRQMTVLTPDPRNKNKPLEKNIKTGLSDGKRVEVLEGLKEGEFLLVPEFQLKEKKAGASSPFGPPTRRRR